MISLRPIFLRVSHWAELIRIVGHGVVKHSDNLPSVRISPAAFEKARAASLRLTSRDAVAADASGEGCFSV